MTNQSDCPETTAPIKKVDYFYPNVTLSEHFFEKFQSKIKKKECYDNIFHIYDAYPPLFLDYPGIEIIYGGVQVMSDENAESNLYARHCFFLFDGKVIDPTLCANGRLVAHKRYIRIHSFTKEAYFAMLLEHKNTLPSTLMRSLNQVGQVLQKQDILLIG